jgi:hypothetical protein
MNNFKSKQERLQIVTKILHQIKRLNLLTDQIPSMQIAVNLLKDYVNIESTQLSGFSGKIQLPEINKEIHYILPIHKQTEATFVIKSKK